MLQKDKKYYGLRQQLSILLTYNPTFSSRIKKYFEMIIMRRIISKHIASKAVKDGMRQYASSQCFAAFCSFNIAISVGDESSRATLAWMLMVGCEGVPKDFVRAHQLTQIGADKCCSDFMGVQAFYYLNIAFEIYLKYQRKNFGVMAYLLNSVGLETYEQLESQRPLLFQKSEDLASKSAAMRSKYGEYILGSMKGERKGGKLVHSAAAKGLDAAQYQIGCWCFQTKRRKQDYPRALQYFYLAAAQGHLEAIDKIYWAHRDGLGIPKNLTEAERWRKRLQEGGAASWY
jgi:TPR repeat protein